MKFITLGTLALTVLLSGTVSATARKDIKQANCELRMVNTASAGEIFLSVFTRTEEECLEKADRQVEVQYISKKGIIRAGGAGPGQ